MSATAAIPRDMILRTTWARNLMARSRDGGWAVGAKAQAVHTAREEGCIRRLGRG